jgi:hypothetical protein
VGRILAILAAWAAVLVVAAPAAADPVDTTPPGVPNVSVLSHWTQGVDRVMAWSDDADLSDEWRISNSPVVDADGMLVNGVTTAAIMYDWDVTDPATGGSGVDGPHDIYVQLRDLAGNWGAVGGAEVILDRTLPVVTAARARFTSDVAVAAPDIAVHWDVSETDANCFGSCSEDGEAQVSVDGATWNTFGVFAGGGTYQVRAQQTDAAGNTSDWTAVAPITVSERQESSEQIAWSGRWTQHAAETAYAGGYRSTIRGGATSKTTITASNIEVIGTATQGGGSMRVYLDGVLKSTVSERGTDAVVLLRANFGKVSSHTIKLVAVASKGHRATFDAILVLRQPA